MVHLADTSQKSRSHSSSNTFCALLHFFRSVLVRNSSISSSDSSKRHFGLWSIAHEASIPIKYTIESLVNCSLFPGRIKSTELQHCCDIVSNGYNIVPTLQRCVALKIVVANRPVRRSYALLQKSHRNHRSYVKRQAPALIYGFRVGAKAIR